MDVIFRKREMDAVRRTATVNQDVFILAVVVYDKPDICFLKWLTFFIFLHVCNDL